MRLFGYKERYMYIYLFHGFILQISCTLNLVHGFRWFPECKFQHRQRFTIESDAIWADMNPNILRVINEFLITTQEGSTSQTLGWYTRAEQEQACIPIGQCTPVGVHHLTYQFASATHYKAMLDVPGDPLSPILLMRLFIFEVPPPVAVTSQ